MSSKYWHFFGFLNEPFRQDIKTDEVFKRTGLDSLEERCLYAVDSRLATIITGEVGSGKSTSLRYVCSKLHPSKYKVFYTIATSSSFLQILKQIAIELQLEGAYSVAVLSKEIRKAFTQIAEKNQIPVIVIDEAHLIRHDIFAQLHTVFQSDFDYKPLSSLILAGQVLLAENLRFPHAKPLASRIVGKSHLDAIKQPEMENYIEHHLKIAGIKNQLFDSAAITAIHQGSGGLLRQANHLARTALIAAAKTQSKTVNADHVRLAASEMICPG